MHFVDIPSIMAKGSEITIEDNIQISATVSEDKIFKKLGILRCTTRTHWHKANSRLALPPRVGSPSGKSWIRHWELIYEIISELPTELIN